MSKLTLKITWQEGQEERFTETELPNLHYTEIMEMIRLLLKTAYKYSDIPYPKGMLKEGERR